MLTIAALSLSCAQECPTQAVLPPTLATPRALIWSPYYGREDADGELEIRGDIGRFVYEDEEHGRVEITFRIDPAW